MTGTEKALGLVTAGVERQRCRWSEVVVSLPARPSPSVGSVVWTRHRVGRWRPPEHGEGHRASCPAVPLGPPTAPEIDMRRQRVVVDDRVADGLVRGRWPTGVGGREVDGERRVEYSFRKFADDWARRIVRSVWPVGERSGAAGGGRSRCRRRRCVGRCVVDGPGFVPAGSPGAPRKPCPRRRSSPHSYWGSGRTGVADRIDALPCGVRGATGSGSVAVLPDLRPRGPRRSSRNIRMSLPIRQEQQAASSPTTILAA